MLRYGTWQAKLTYANICQVIKQQNPEAQAPELPKNFIRFVKSYDPDDNRIVTMEHAAFLDMYNQYLLESIYREMDEIRQSNPTTTRCNSCKSVWERKRLDSPKS